MKSPGPESFDYDDQCPLLPKTGPAVKERAALRQRGPCFAKLARSLARIPIPQERNALWPARCGRGQYEREVEPRYQRDAGGGPSCGGGWFACGGGCIRCGACIPGGPCIGGPCI